MSTSSRGLMEARPGGIRTESERKSRGRGACPGGHKSLP